VGISPSTPVRAANETFTAPGMIANEPLPASAGNGAQGYRAAWDKPGDDDNIGAWVQAKSGSPFVRDLAVFGYCCKSTKWNWIIFFHLCNITPLESFIDFLQSIDNFGINYVFIHNRFPFSLSDVLTG